MKSTARDAVFALEFTPGTPPLVRDVAAASWTTEAFKVLIQIHAQAKSRAKDDDGETDVQLPFASLRAQLQLEIDDWTTLQDDIGLRSPYLPRGEDPKAWGFLSRTAGPDTRQKFTNAFARWVEGTLAAYSQNHGAHTLGITTLRRLNQADQVLHISPSQVQIFPWCSQPRSGAPTPFDVTAAMLADRLAGHELFPGLGPVVRVMEGSNRNRTEVMTRPHDAAGGWFSLVCELTIETLPGATKPVVYCRFKRRRWADTVNAGYAASSSIGGFVFPHAARPDKAYRFNILRRKGKWTTGLDYPQYQHAFSLAAGYDDERVLDYPCDEQRASVVVMVKAEVTDHGDSELQAGVPLADQADAFDRITRELHELGLRPFTDFRAVKTPSFKAPKLSMLKAEVMLARLLERHAVDKGDATRVGDALEAATAMPAGHWFKSGIPTPDPGHEQVIRAIRLLTADTAQSSDQTRQVLYLVSQVPEDIEWIKTTAHAMLGDAIHVISVPLPARTHGPKQDLPAAGEKAQQRFDARRREWLKFATGVGLPPRAMVLVQAPLFYSVAGGKSKPDDQVNKLACRKALASHGCTVQYLLPCEPGRVDKFLPRVQAALLDLVFGHAGSVWGLRQACATCFGGASPAPRWVGAVSSLLVHTEWGRPQSMFVATKLDCVTGQAWVRFAHQAAAAIQTDWMRFDEGAKYLVDGRIELPRARADQSHLLAQFFENTFDQMAAIDRNAVMFIDSTRLARLAKWLSDSGICDKHRTIAPGITMTGRWPTLRLLRIREQAPAIGQEKLHAASTPDGHALRTWTSTQRLFEVGGTTAPTFWSLARPSTHHKRGASCYREMLLPNSSKTQEKQGDFTPFPAQPDRQHLNPHAIEVVILQQQPDDDAIQLASFAQHLRAGLLTARNERWVTTPTPLRIIDKLAEYMKA